ncbi:MAG: class I SAM-dependent methyltransferase [Pseudomonadota bacterium]
MSDGPGGEATSGPGIGVLFDRAAQGYDAERPKLVPCFEEFYGAAVEAVGPLAPGARLLDLGAGTGLLAAMIAVSRPSLDVTLVDLSAEMLNRAPGRFAAAGLSQPQLVTGDYAVAMPEGPFEAIVSALSIHHLDDAGKAQVFAGVADRLSPGGGFVNAEQVLGETAAA